MVWYGMVWYDMVWYGKVWYGMVWYGIVQCIFVVPYSPKGRIALVTIKVLYPDIYYYNNLTFENYYDYAIE